MTSSKSLDSLVIMVFMWATCLMVASSMLMTLSYYLAVVVACRVSEIFAVIMRYSLRYGAVQ